MKKFVCLFLALMLAVSVCGCGANNESPSENSSPVAEDTPALTENTTVPTENIPESAPDEDKAEENDISVGLDALGDIDVEQGLFNVTITLPADFVEEGTTQEDVDNQAKEAGWKSATLNEDGSMTFVVTKAQHDEMMAEISASIDQSLQEMIGSEDYPNIVSIEANEDYTSYRIVTKNAELDFAESFSVLAFYMNSGMYHIFNGTEPENIHVEFVNEATGKIISESNSNDLGE